MRKLITGLTIITFGIILSVSIFAQAPRPPANQGTSGNQPPGTNPPTGTPIEPGTGILLILAAGYALTKVREIRKVL